MPSLTTSQKLALAVSVPFAAVGLYMLFKWIGEDDEELEENEATSQEFFSSSDVVLEVKIPQCYTGAVIGRAGCVIKQIQKESNTRINFKDEDSADESEAEKQRTILIRGSRERSKQAELLIRKIILEQPVMEKGTMDIPQQAIGRIIGKGGKTIRQLSRISGAKITIARGEELCSSQTCEIVGTDSEIKYAKQLIEEKINEDKLFRAKDQHGKDYNVESKSTFVQLPSDGEYFGVYVSAIETPGCFWIQKVAKDAKELDELVEEMTVFYGEQGGGQTLSSLKVQDLCCAPFQHDKSWYRGEISEIISPTEVRIFYLDFGDTGTVLTVNVKELRKEFCQLPFQAIECCLANIQPKDMKWCKVACDVFEKISFCAEWKVLMARIVCYKNGIPCIELFNTNGDQDINIEEELVKQDHAVYKKKLRRDEVKDIPENPSTVEKPSKSEEEPIIVENVTALQEVYEQFQSPNDEIWDMPGTPALESHSAQTCTQLDISLEQTHDTDLRVRELANEAPLSAVEHNVVSCVDLSKLPTLLHAENLGNLPQVTQNGCITPELAVLSADDVEGTGNEPLTDKIQTLSLEENHFDEVKHIGSDSVQGMINNEASTTEGFLQSESMSDLNVENPANTSSTDIDLIQEEVVDNLKTELSFAEYEVCRRYSDEPITNTTLSDHHGNSTMMRSSSEIVVSPRRSKQEEKVDGKEKICSKSLGSLSHLTKGSKRLLAANFNQLSRRSKQESDNEEDEDDDDSLYLSARDDSDSVGFLSATESNTNLRTIDTDSDVTPSGYLSDADDDSNDSLEGNTLPDQVRLDTTLVAEKLEQYTDK